MANAGSNALLPSVATQTNALLDTVRNLRLYYERATGLDEAGLSVFLIYSMALSSLEAYEHKLTWMNEAWGTARPKALPSHLDMNQDQEVAARILDVLRQLQAICKDIANCISLQPPKPPPQPFMYWCIRWIRKKPRSYDLKPTKLDDLVEGLGNVLDELWAYYLALSERHQRPFMANRSFLDEPDGTGAERCRASMVMLHHVCGMFKNVTEKEMAAVDLNLIRPEAGTVQSMLPLESSFSPLKAQLYFGSTSAPHTLSQLRLQSVQSPGSRSKSIPILGKSTMAGSIGFTSIRDPEPAEWTLTPEFARMVKLGAPGDYARATQSGMKTPLFYRVDEPLTPGRADVTVTKLSDLLKLGGRFSVEERVELAYIVAQFGYFMLGTPWASYLRSSNIHRISSTSTGKSHFVLDVSDPADRKAMLFDTARLYETNHLHQIGTLLVEIASLQQFGSPPPPPVKPQGTWLQRMRPLSSVFSVMGRDYCNATAFCLSTRKPSAASKTRDKYDFSWNRDWRVEMAITLAEYEHNVLARLDKFHGIISSIAQSSKKI